MSVTKLLWLNDIRYPATKVSEQVNIGTGPRSRDFSSFNPYTNPIQYTRWYTIPSGEFINYIYANNRNP